MYATLRFRRRPISNDIVCLRLVCNTALPAHKDPAHVEEISDYATRQQVEERVQLAARMLRCAHVELDLRGDVAKRLERNG
jgi:hypothetical protein